MTLIDDAKREERRSRAVMRRTKRKPKPLVLVKDWTTYPHEFVPLKALSIRWGEAEQTIRKWIRNGALRGFRFGGLWKVQATDARAFEEKSEFRVAV